MGLILIGVGGAIYFTLGSAHGYMTLQDLRQPRYFTPTDPAVREAMAGTGVALHPPANLWQAWLGFNLSHSLGLIIFGGGTVWLALFAPTILSSWAVAATIIGSSCAYVAMALRFWFWGPTVGSSFASLCFLLGYVLGPN